MADLELQTVRQQVVDLLLRHTPGDGVHEAALAGLSGSCGVHLIRASAPAQALPAIYDPGLVLVLQGRKKVMLGDGVLHYDPLHCLLVSMTVLPRGQIIEASPDKPYLCLRLGCDTQSLADLLLEAGPDQASSDAGLPWPQGPLAEAAPRAARDPGTQGLNLAPVTAPLLDAALRLLRLLDHPQDQRVLAPLVRREILYRVLTGPLGPQLRALAAGDSATRRIARAVDQLTRRFAEPLRIEELAALAHMSPSTLHQRFKQHTTLSPLQYQKQLRLQHARRLMLGDGLDAADAAHRVGYESPSQFSREYRRLFGTPPRADIDQLRAASTT